jgi:hypothetical protein
MIMCTSLDTPRGTCFAHVPSHVPSHLSIDTCRLHPERARARESESESESENESERERLIDTQREGESSRARVPACVF